MGANNKTTGTTLQSIVPNQKVLINMENLSPELKDGFW